MDKLVEQARAKLRAQHLRWTKQREMMLKIMTADPEHYQDITVIDDALRAAYPGLSHDTIYRNLKEFERLDLVPNSCQGPGLRAILLSCGEFVPNVAASTYNKFQSSLTFTSHKIGYDIG